MPAKKKLQPHYKVRVYMAGAGIIHLASTDRPELVYWDGGHDRPDAVYADWIEDPDYGDSIGNIVWSEATAITWRFHRG